MNQGRLLQVLAVVILLLATRGFFVFNNTNLYFPALIAGVIAFAVLLFRGGAMARKAKNEQK